VCVPWSLPRPITAGVASHSPTRSPKLFLRSLIGFFPFPSLPSNSRQDRTATVLHNLERKPKTSLPPNILFRWKAYPYAPLLTFVSLWFPHFVPLTNALPPCPTVVDQRSTDHISYATLLNLTPPTPPQESLHRFEISILPPCNPQIPPPLLVFLRLLPQYNEPRSTVVSLPAPRLSSRTLQMIPDDPRPPSAAFRGVHHLFYLNPFPLRLSAPRQEKIYRRLFRFD